MKHYRSSIPKAAKERVVATFITGPQKYKARCTLNGELVGIRLFHETGDLAWEHPLKNARPHGTLYRSDVPGKLLSARPYRNGLAHGIGRQWCDEGKLLGTSTMRHGTGVDLWWQDHDGFAYLSEARYLKDGKWHGFEWWLNEDQESVMVERHFRNDQLHGIERWWNSRARLRRGYPRYWLANTRVTKRQYLRERAKDPTLPPFREKDNRPQRKFPPEVAVHCIQRAV